MTTIIDALNGGVGVQTYNTEINQFATAPGRGDVLVHTNGNVYVVYAETNTGGGTTRSIYFASSTDKGVTWTTPVQLTSGNWDDDPCIIQLNPLSTSSDLGLVFNREAQNPSFGQPTTTLGYRCTVTIGGTINSPVDPVGSGTITQTTGFYGFRFLNVNVLPSGLFMISGLTVGGYPSIWYNTISFLSNNWVPYHNFTSSDMPNLPVSFKMRPLENGDFVAVYAARTSLNGVWGATPEGSVKTDIYFMASLAVNNAQTWTTPQNMTNYTGSPTFDLVGFSAGMDADVVQFNDDTLTLIYTEGLGSQFLSYSTTPPINGTVGVISAIALHTQSNNLLLGGAASGFFTYNLSTGTMVRYSTSSSQPTWSNNVKHIAVSTNGTHIAVSTDLSLELFATNGSSDPTMWTLTSLRTTTTPATNGTVANIVYVDPAFLAVGWTNSGIGNSALSIIDCSNINLGFTNLTTTGVQTCDNYRNSLTYINGILRFSSGASYYHYDYAGSSPGTNYGTNCGLAFLVDMAYDDVNQVFYLVSGQNANITSITDSGSSFSSHVVSSSLTGQAPSFVCAVPGAGMFYNSQPVGDNHGPGNQSVSNAVGIGFYSFVTQTWYGTFEGQLEFFYQRPWFDTSFINGLGPSLVTYLSNGWIVFVTGVNANFLRGINTDQVGRLRTGNGTYSGGILTLNTFYDMVNQTRLGVQGNKATFHHIAVTEDNTVVLIADELGYDYGARPVAIFTGTMSTGTQTVSIKCDIKNKSTRQLQIRSWISTRTFRHVQCQARIAHEACIKIQCHIIPRTARTIQISASIRNTKQTVLPCSFDIAANFQTITQCSFFISTGGYGKQGIGVGCKVARLITQKITGHFTIPASPVTGPVATGFTFSGTPGSRAQIGIGAFIS